MSILNAEDSKLESGLELEEKAVNTDVRIVGLRRFKEEIRGLIYNFETDRDFLFVAKKDAGLDNLLKILRSHHALRLQLHDKLEEFGVLSGERPHEIFADHEIMEKITASFDSLAAYRTRIVIQKRERDDNVQKRNQLERNIDAARNAIRTMIEGRLTEINSATSGLWARVTKKSAKHEAEVMACNVLIRRIDESNFQNWDDELQMIKLESLQEQAEKLTAQVNELSSMVILPVEETREGEMEAACQKMMMDYITSMEGKMYEEKSLRSLEIKASTSIQKLELLKKLELTEEDEKIALNNDREPNDLPAIRRGLERSFSNMRVSVGHYVKKMGHHAVTNLTQYPPKLENLNLAFSASPEVIFELLKSEKISKLSEDNRTPRTAGYRIDTERELGWQGGDVTYFAVVEEHDSQQIFHYGDVSLLFDFNIYADSATFTEGDSMNPSGLSVELRDLKIPMGTSIPGSVKTRQIHRKHVALAKTVLSHNNSNMGHDYIEAQVGAQVTMKGLKMVQIKRSAVERDASDINSIMDFCNEKRIPVKIV